MKADGTLRSAGGTDDGSHRGTGFVRRELGMTLLELLVAIAIFGVIGSALYPVITGTLGSRSAATERASIDAEARLILDRLEQDLEGNVDAGFQGERPARFVALSPGGARARGERRILELTTVVARGVTPSDAYFGGEAVAALHVDRGDLAQVLWRIDADGRLLRQELRPPTIDEVDWTRVPVEVLSDRADVVLEHFEEPNWITDWNSVEAGPHRDKAPVAVRTTLAIAEEDGAPFELVSTTLLPVMATSDRPGRHGARP
jgi:prepilin-type N-terminal cleavage/methylation domain-containing protein